MKRFLAAVLAGVMALSLIACDESSYSDSSGNSSETVDDIIGDINELLGDIFGEDSDTSSNEADLLDKTFDTEDNESSDSTNFSFAMSGIEFSIPSTFEKNPGSTETNTTFSEYYDNTKFFEKYLGLPEINTTNTTISEYYDDTKFNVLLFIEEESPISQEEFDKVKNLMFDSYTKNAEEILYSEDTSIAGLPGKTFAFIGTNSNNLEVSSYVTFIYNTDNNKLLDVILVFPRHCDAYTEFYNQILETARLVSQDTSTDTPDLSIEVPSSNDKIDNSVSYSTNDLATAKKGNTGVFAYKHSGKSYNIYWIIDFDEGYVYYFTEGNGEDACDRLKIESGDLNSVLIITYHDGGDTWSNGMHFKWKNRPDIMIHEDNYGFETKFTTTDLDDALAIRDTRTIHDY